MPRYIKDGAYTIVIEDANDSKINTSRSELTKDSNKPHEGSESIIDPDDETFKQEQKEEHIDYSSPDFILQNLEIATPNLKKEKTTFLASRVEMGDIVSIQICFYVYLALQFYVTRQEFPIILVMGDGFMGSKVIHMLAKHGCGPLLRIYSRGEISAKEWVSKGYKSSTSLEYLMKEQKPSIIIICAEYTSFYLINHQLAANDLFSSNACLIFSTLGFNRKKLAQTFNIPTVFRTFLEPGPLIKSVTDQYQDKIIDDDENNLETIDAAFGTVVERPKTFMDLVLDAVEKEEDVIAADASIKQSVSSHNLGTASADDASSTVATSEPPKREQTAAILFTKRTKNVALFINLVENYYTLNGIPHDEARRLALRCCLGYVARVEQSTEDKLRRRKARRANMNGTEKRVRKPAVVVKEIEKILLSIYSEIACIFHKELSNLLSESELTRLTTENMEEVHKSAMDQERNMNGDSIGEEVVDKVENAHFHHHLLNKPEKEVVKPLFGKSYVYDIFALDDDISDLQGPGFDFIRILNERDNRRLGKKKANRPVLGSVSVEKLAVPSYDEAAEAANDSELVVDLKSTAEEEAGLSKVNAKLGIVKQASILSALSDVLSLK